MDLLYFHDALHECSLRAVGMAALGGAFPPDLGARAVDVIAARAAAGAVPPAQWHSLLAALLLGSMSGGKRRPPVCFAGSLPWPLPPRRASCKSQEHVQPQAAPWLCEPAS